jgi:hypothetical protein
MTSAQRPTGRTHPGVVCVAPHVGYFGRHTVPCIKLFHGLVCDQLQGSNMGAQTRKYSCPYCNRGFARKEHLDRHTQRHTGTKPFRCRSCAKDFARRYDWMRTSHRPCRQKTDVEPGISDTLLRHEATHDQSLTDNLFVPSASRRRRHACTECARSKQRCRGVPLCNRCQEKGLLCQTTSNRPGIQENQASPPESNNVVGDDVPEANELPTEHDRREGSVDLMATSNAPPEGEETSTTMPPGLSTTDCEILSADTVRYSNITETAMQFEDPGMDLPVDLAGFIFPDPSNLDYADLSFISPGHSFFSTMAMSATTAPDLSGESSNHVSTIRPLNDVTTTPASLPSPPITHGQSDGVCSINRSAPGIQSPHTAVEPSQSTPSSVSDPSRHSILAEDDAILIEDFCHVEKMDSQAYERIYTFFRQQERSLPTEFPSARLLHVFVQLYFEYFDASYPFVHPLFLTEDETSWILLLAVAAIGSQYSAVTNANRYSANLKNLLHLAISHQVSLSRTCRDHGIDFDSSLRTYGDRLCHSCRVYS